ncbi:ATP/GTP-binding protein [Streptomyces albidoflavus]|uniref:ATP/GTP-binding protein n=1 Tax=Streptomyces albidoflavus TaxID=1886 RepID=UPI0033C7F816
MVAGLLAPAAHADGGEVCRRSGLVVTVCAEEAGKPVGNGGGNPRAASAGTESAAGSSAPKCYYERADPQPPPVNLAYKDRKGNEPGAVYRVSCPETMRVGVIWIPDGQEPGAEPQIDPEVLARQAVDSMTLRPPKVASPRADGRYLIGMPMWMWVEPGESRMGPVSVSASAGSVTVTATARVDRLVWDMGDGIKVTCHGPGTRYTPDQGKAMSPDCGHRYERPGEHPVTVTAHWNIDWTSTGSGGGTLTETRTTELVADLREAQVLNTR